MKTKVRGKPPLSFFPASAPEALQGGLHLDDEASPSAEPRKIPAGHEAADSRPRSSDPCPAVIAPKARQQFAGRPSGRLEQSRRVSTAALKITAPSLQ